LELNINGIEKKILQKDSWGIRLQALKKAVLVLPAKVLAYPQYWDNTEALSSIRH
jgi:hypothetical protein